MGQATVDLPDPMNPPPATAGGTDELLAQLAGEEIDRLLAEADAEQAAGEKSGAGVAPRGNIEAGAASPSAPGAASREASSAEAADAELSAQLDNLFADLTVNAPDSPLLGRASAADLPAFSATDSPATATATREDDLIASTDVAAQSSPPSAGAGTSGSEVASVHPVEEELRATEALERGARTAASVAPEDETLAALACEEPRPLPLFLRPLEWINAPLDALPESVRNIVGKVAILTTINALSILAYVFFFRRH